MRLAARRLASTAAARRPPRPPPPPRDSFLAARPPARRRSTVVAAAPATAGATKSGGGTWSFYAQPALYEAVFDLGRDYDAEVAFVASALATHGARPFTTFLDVGCGPARHARAAAAAGVTAYALDASPDMLAAAIAGAEADGVAITPITADFTAPYAVPAPVDAALLALGTLAHAVEPGAPAATLAALAAALAPGGVAVLELPPAADVFDGALIGGDAWDVEACPATGGVAAVVEYGGGPEDDFNPITQVLTRTVALSEVDPKSGAAVRELGRELVRQRVFTPAEVRALAVGAGLQVAAELGDMDPRADPVDGDRYVVVLRKP